MTSISWNAEGGSDATVISTANSGGASGTAWDTCQRGTNATNEYDSAQFANGALSALIATGVTSTTAYNRWNAALTALWASGLTTHYGRFSFRLAALPGANRVIVEFLDTTAATNRANFLMLTTGALRLRNAANGTVATFATTCSVDTWYRVEYRIDGSTAGAYEMHLYLGNSTSALEDIVGGTANFGGTIGCVNYGYVSNGANLASAWYDSIQINDTGLPGPEVSSTPVTVTATAGAARGYGTQSEVTAAVEVSPASGAVRAYGTQATATGAAEVTPAAGGARAYGSQSDVSAGQTLDTTAGAARATGTQSSITTAATISPDAGAMRWLGTQSTVVTGGVPVTVATTAGAARFLGGRVCTRAGSTVTRPSTGLVTLPDTGGVYRPDSGKVCRP